MSTKKWLVGAVAAVSLTTIAGTSALALQDSAPGGKGGDGGDGGHFEGEVEAEGGDADVEGNGACDNNQGGANGEATTACRGFNARGGSARLTVRTGRGGNGGNGARSGRGGDRVSIRRAAGGFPF